jgi:hypothetical protein
MTFYKHGLNEGQVIHTIASFRQPSSCWMVCFRELILGWVVALTFTYIMHQMPLSRRFRSGKYRDQTTSDQCAAMFTSRNSKWKRQHAWACHPVDKYDFYQDVCAQQENGQLPGSKVSRNRFAGMGGGGPSPPSSGKKSQLRPSRDGWDHERR